MPEGILSRTSPYSVAQTVDRLVALLEIKGVPVFARIDHSGEAAKAGFSMLPTQLLIFGNPKGGTPIMFAEPLSAIDLPLKALIWEDEAGTVRLSYYDPEYLQQRFAIAPELLAPIAALSTLIQQSLA